VALAEGRALDAAIRFANAAAALSVTRAGAQASIPARREVEALLS
jgi:ribokinase